MAPGRGQPRSGQSRRAARRVLSAPTVDAAVGLLILQLLILIADPKCSGPGMPMPTRETQLPECVSLLSALGLPSTNHHDNCRMLFAY